MIVGLTGGIASGKSLCADFFAQKGCPVIDADEVARAVISPPSSLLADLVEQFGAEILHDDGTLNRRALREIVFSDPTQKARLDTLMHPAIKTSILELLARYQASSLVILMVPLLFEKGWECYCDVVIALDVNRDTQIERGSRRDGQHPDDFQKIIDAQIGREARVKRAHFIINNDEDRASTLAQCEVIYQRLLALTL